MSISERMSGSSGKWTTLTVPAGTATISNNTLSILGKNIDLPTSSAYKTPVIDYNNPQGPKVTGYTTLSGTVESNTDVTYEYAAITLDVYWPNTYSGKSMIVLHGFGHTANDWKTSVIAQYAEQYQVALFAPTLTINGASMNYLSQRYAETQASILDASDNFKLPGIIFAGALLPLWIEQEFDNPEIYLAGYSTGAIGVNQSCAYFPQHFKGIGYMSSDWITVNATGAIYTNSYGSVESSQSKRIKDSAAYLAERMQNLKVFIANGTTDNRTPATQAFMMKTAMIKNGNIVQEFYGQGGHDFTFWNSAIPNMFASLFSNIKTGQNKLKNFNFTTAVDNLSSKENAIGNWSNLVTIVNDYIKIQLPSSAVSLGNILNVYMAAAIIGSGFTDDDNITAAGIISFLLSPLSLSTLFNTTRNNLTLTQNKLNLDDSFLDAVAIAIAWNQSDRDNKIEVDIESIHEDYKDQISSDINNLTINYVSNQLKDKLSIFNKINNDNVLTTTTPLYYQAIRANTKFGTPNCAKEIAASLSTNLCSLCITSNNVFIIAEGHISDGNDNKTTKFKYIDMNNFDGTIKQNTNLEFLGTTFKHIVLDITTSDTNINNNFQENKSKSKIECQQRTFNNKSNNSSISIDMSNASNAQRAYENFVNFTKKLNITNSDLLTSIEQLKSATSSNIISIMSSIITKINNETNKDNNLLIKVLRDSIKAIKKLIMDQYTENQYGNTLADISILMSKMNIEYGIVDGKSIAGSYYNYKAEVNNTVIPTIHGKNNKENDNPSLDCSAFVDFCLEILGIGNGTVRMSNNGNKQWLPLQSSWNTAGIRVSTPGGDMNIVYEDKYFTPIQTPERGCLFAWPGHIMIVTKVENGEITEIVNSATNARLSSDKAGSGSGLERVPKGMSGDPNFIQRHIEYAKTFDHKFVKIK